MQNFSAAQSDLGVRTAYDATLRLTLLPYEHAITKTWKSEKINKYKSIFQRILTQ